MSNTGISLVNVGVRVRNLVGMIHMDHPSLNLKLYLNVDHSLVK